MQVAMRQATTVERGSSMTPMVRSMQSHGHRTRIESVFRPASSFVFFSSTVFEGRASRAPVLTLLVVEKARKPSGSGSVKYESPGMTDLSSTLFRLISRDC